jgi:hypothetical protein
MLLTLFDVDTFGADEFRHALRAVVVVIENIVSYLSLESIEAILPNRPVVDRFLL